MPRKRPGKSSRAVGHRELARALREEFPRGEFKLSPAGPGGPGQCLLTAWGDDSREVCRRAQVLACVAVLFNRAARPVRRGRWTDFAACLRVRHGASRTEVVLRRGDEGVRFYLEPTAGTRGAHAGRRLRLHLREV